MAAQVFLSLLFSGGLVWLSFWQMGESSWLSEGKQFAGAAALLFLAALGLRLSLAALTPGYGPDMDTFKAWAYALVNRGFTGIYREEDFFLDYPPGYLYVLVLLEKIRSWLDIPFYSQSYTLIIKLPSLLADLACGGVLLVLGKRKKGELAGLLAAGIYLFSPVVLVNSARWGQVDSFCTAILLASFLLLWKEYWVPAGLLYGLSVVCKPQMLIFAPAYLFFALRRKKYLGLGLGIVSTIGAVLLAALPFTQHFDFTWLWERYRSTLDYYNYYSINAYNFWTLIGRNWWGLPGGAVQTVLTALPPVLATAGCGALLLRSEKKESLFAAPVLLMTVMYLFSVKMHERYFYPAFIFLLLLWVFLPRWDGRLLRGYGVCALANHLNVAYVLYLLDEFGANYDPNSLLTRFLALLQTLALCGLLWRLFAACFGKDRAPGHRESGKLSAMLKASLPRLTREREEGEEVPALPEAMPEKRFTRLDVILMLGVTVLYALLAFWQLGSRDSIPMSAWTPHEGESVVLQADGPVNAVSFLPGLTADDSGARPRLGVNVRVESSSDGQAWSDCGLLSDGGTYVFTWAKLDLAEPGTYLRLTALDGSAVVNEVALRRQGEEASFAGLSVLEGSGEALIDEQGSVPYYPGYLESMYFDEIYHGRTAYEHILHLEPYENTHPPLGKLILSLGIRLFGMNPFGWRFMGTLFGVLMLPALYHLLHQLLGKPWLCALGTAWFALDFMHFTQTRIATIDTYAVFFLLLMVDAMVWFLRQDLETAPMRKLLPPLLLSGIFTGLGIASKWTAAYGAVGLAVLYFAKLFFSWWDRRKGEEEERRALLKKELKLCLWCCLFFIAIPVLLYFLAFLPMTTLPQNRADVLGSFIRYNVNMFNYHAGLQAEHYFASPWYEWPFDVRPIWYFTTSSADAAGHYSTISALGNPLLWWAGIPALLTAFWFWFKKRRLWAGVTLAGFGSVYLPWVLVPRLTFIYHYFTAVPFLVIALAGALSALDDSALGQRRLSLGRERSLRVSWLAGGLFTLLLFILFCAFFPVISGAPTDRSYTDSLRWFSTWYF